MAKAADRKQLLGIKLPKSIRKSTLFKNMLATPAGREMLAKALIAGAHAAAEALTREDRQPPRKGRSRSKRPTTDAAERAMQSATEAATETVTAPARALFRARNDGPIFSHTSH